MKRQNPLQRRLGAAIMALLTAAAVALPAVAGSWSNRRPMETARSHMGAAVLNGEVYVAGGTGILGPMDSFEVYDPRADHWRPLPSLPRGRQQFGMAALDSRIVVTGGYQEEALTRESAEMWVYDPRTSQWAKGPDMPDGRAGHVLVPVNGKLYAIGGTGKDARRIFVYDQNSRKWAVAPFRLAAVRSGLAAVPLNGRIYVAGGASPGGASSARLDILDPGKGTWQAGSALPEALAGFAMTVIDGQIHIAGGSSVTDMRTYADHFVYDPGSNRWSRQTSMPTPRHSMASAQVDGRWYVMGGGSGVGFFTVFTDADIVEMYDPEAE